MIAFMYIAVVLISYTLGSIPFGLIISKKFANTDLRQVGSGKIGTTNVLRTAGRKAAALALILDIAKGAFAVAIASLIFSSKNQPNDGMFTWSESAKALAALSAIAGHSWSVFLRFKGGRGVATFVGGLLALYWPAGVVGGVFILGIGFRTKYMSLGSIIGAVTAFIMLMSFNIARLNFLRPYPPFEYVIFSMISAIFIYVMHRDNITRLFNGTERKLGDRVKAETSPSTSNSKNIF
jgi:glycerol-3-phosphate acyltransferase PlsY